MGPPVRASELDAATFLLTWWVCLRTSGVAEVSTAREPGLEAAPRGRSRRFRSARSPPCGLLQVRGQSTIPSRVALPSCSSPVGEAKGWLAKQMKHIDAPGEDSLEKLTAVVAGYVLVPILVDGHQAFLQILPDMTRIPLQVARTVDGTDN